MTSVNVMGLDKYLPERVVPNSDLETLLDTADEWIVKRTGIHSRRYAAKTESTSDLGFKAATRALEKSGWKAQDLDLILFATISPDHEFPGTACFLQKKLGIRDIPAIDIRQQCSGYLFALSVAQQYLIAGNAKRILLVASEIHSKCLDLTPRGRQVSVIFGDGAAATLLGAEEAQGPHLARLIDLTIGCDGSQAEELWCPAPGTGFESDQRVEPWMIEDALIYPKMNGRRVFTGAVQVMSSQLQELCLRNKCSLDDIDLFVIHQANVRIAEAIADQLKQPVDKFFNTIHQYGNTTAASIPLGLCEARDVGQLKPGMKVALASFGAGFTYGSALLEWI